jgi:hypothetical protein
MKKSGTSWGRGRFCFCRQPENCARYNGFMWRKTVENVYGELAHESLPKEPC